MIDYYNFVNNSEKNIDSKNKVKKEIIDKEIILESNNDHFYQKENNDKKETIKTDITKPDNIYKFGYKIYRDKIETFMCEIEILGADIQNSKSRLIIETDSLTYLFEGIIDENGNCKIPLKKMNFLDEYSTGTIKLEIIAEDTLFVPWESDFIVMNSKKVEVKLQESIDQSENKIGIKIKNINI